MADTDLTSRIAELFATIEAKLAEDEKLATGASQEGPNWRQPDPDRTPGYIDSDRGVVAYDEGYPTEEQAAHIVRNDPEHTFRRVKATRNLVAAILAEQHDYNPGDEYYSCSQAQEGTGLRTGPTGPPGSGCADDDRAGKPCDCGRDARVARLLGIIASEWEE